MKDLVPLSRFIRLVPEVVLTSEARVVKTKRRSSRKEVGKSVAGVVARYNADPCYWLSQLYHARCERDMDRAVEALKAFGYFVEVRDARSSSARRSALRLVEVASWDPRAGGRCFLPTLPDHP